MTKDQSKSCPNCQGERTRPFIEIDQVPVYCNVLWPDQEGALRAPRGDISLTFCETCGHIYNSRFDEGLVNYNQTYENSLHHSAVFQQYASALVDNLIERYVLRRKKIVEIGAGQGDFLQMLCAQGDNQGTGFDPSFVPGTDLPDYLKIIPAYYTEAFASYPADFIVCRHVLEHIEQSGAFLAMVRRIIGNRQDIVTFFEVPNVLWTVRENGIWDIIYEHCGYFSPTSLAYAFRQNRFEVLNVEKVFGGQFLTIEAAPLDDEGDELNQANGNHTAQVGRLADDVGAFAANYRGKIEEWRQLFASLRARGEKAVIWGAGSKGVTFLNIMSPGDVIEYAVDINPRKTGMFVSGAGQKIVTPDFLSTYQPDVVIIMNANYENEIGRTLRDLGVSAKILLA